MRILDDSLVLHGSLFAFRIKGPKRRRTEKPIIDTVDGANQIPLLVPGAGVHPKESIPALDSPEPANHGRTAAENGKQLDSGWRVVIG